MQSSIFFFGEKNKWGELSNFYKLEKQIIYNNKSYPTSEHLYQALKYIYDDSKANLEYAEEIRKSSTPYIAKLLANQKQLYGHDWMKKINEIIEKYKKRGVKRREDWEQVKVEIMEKVLRLKFSTDKHCLTILSNTGDAILVENSPYDDYWGCGKNMLGKLLMKIRDEFTLL